MKLNVCDKVMCVKPIVGHTVGKVYCIQYVQEVGDTNFAYYTDDEGNNVDALDIEGDALRFYLAKVESPEDEEYEGESHMASEEIGVMSFIEKIFRVADLDEGAQTRVVEWVISKYGEF